MTIDFMPCGRANLAVKKAGRTSVSSTHRGPHHLGRLERPTMANEEGSASAATKRCERCKESKPLADFAKNRRHRDGLSNRCRACQKIAAASHYQRNIERRRAENRAYAESHKETLSARAAEYRKENAARIIAKQLEWARANPERRAATTAKCRKANPDAYRARGLAWSRANPDKVSVKEQRRRAALRKAPGRGVNKSEWAAILEFFGGRCAYCARRMPLAMDHIEPLSKGGAHDPENVVPACKTCNSSKYTKTPVFWLLALAKRRAAA